MSPVLFSNSPNDFGAPANALKPPPPPDAKALKPPVEGVEKADWGGLGGLLNAPPGMDDAPNVGAGELGVMVPKTLFVTAPGIDDWPKAGAPVVGFVGVEGELDARANAEIGGCAGAGL